MKHTNTLGLALVQSLLVSCGAYESLGGPGGPGGATVGGVKDANYAREVVAQGRLPTKEALRVEALFAEHDFPLEGPPCNEVLCLAGATGIADDVSGRASAWMQLALSSGQEAPRPPLAIIAVVDVSCSMGWRTGGNAEFATPGELSRRLAAKLAARLEERDSFALITFGSSVHVALALTPGSDQARIQAAIERLAEDGSTNMEAGLVAAYALAGGIEGPQDKRVLLFTDTQPNVGATASSEFSSMVRDAAARGTFTSVYGMGLGLGTELFAAMATHKGGNAFSFVTSDQVDRFVEHSWPWAAFPIAHNFKLELSEVTGASVQASYGFPGADDATTALRAESVFLSHERGTLLVRLADGAPEPHALPTVSAKLHLSYQTRSGQPIDQELLLSTESAGGGFASPATRKAVALAVLGTALGQALDLYATEPERAETVARAAAVRFPQDVAPLGADPLLDRDRHLAEDIARLIGARASQDSFYGQ